MRFVGDLTANFLGGAQGTKIEEFYSFRFGAGYREAFRGISESKRWSKTQYQIYIRFTTSLLWERKGQNEEFYESSAGLPQSFREGK